MSTAHRLLIECRGVCKWFGPVQALADVVFEIADRIVVLYVGRREATFERASTSRDEVVSAIAGLQRHDGLVTA